MHPEFYLHDIPVLQFNFATFWSVKARGLNTSGQLFLEKSARRQVPEEFIDPRAIFPLPTPSKAFEGSSHGPSIDVRCTAPVSQRQKEVCPPPTLKRKRSLSEDWVADPKMPMGMEGKGKGKEKMVYPSSQQPGVSLDSGCTSGAGGVGEATVCLPVQSAPRKGTPKRKLGTCEEGSPDMDDDDADGDYEPCSKRRKGNATVVCRRGKKQGPRPASISSSITTGESSSMASAKGKGRLVCGLDGCTAEANSKGDMARHQMSKRHVKDSNIRCEICGQGFSRIDGLRRHVKNGNNLCGAQLIEKYSKTPSQD